MTIVCSPVLILMLLRFIVLKNDLEATRMNLIKGFFSRGGEAGELLQFLWKAKLWFLIPMVAVLLVFGLLLIFAQATGVAPFVYTLF